MRKPCCDKQDMNKGAWSKEEDRKLIDYVTKHGEGKWRSLPQAAVKSIHQQDALTSQEPDLSLKLAASNPSEEMKQNLVYSTDAKEEIAVKSSTLLLFK
ncbi:hypothetical protein Pint_17009 [Pistacia integerrima]|uniref:Uncharacterized protein n=2 Tax=Pistacia integerrima TaxID=434235 RepID=A0ACC0ZAL2_9ROSI|nr:hypothetical protein Pint_17014 [Pistacia integerrima]KAJ0048449.1 hypothetical protein Pint_17009 [Pistacia integerrima]